MEAEVFGFITKGIHQGITGQCTLLTANMSRVIIIVELIVFNICTMCSCPADVLLGHVSGVGVLQLLHYC